MTAVISIIKIIMFMFPFVKEIFVSKDTRGYDRRRRPSTKITLLKKIFILLICLSVVLNYYLMVKVFDLGRKNVILQKQIEDKPNKPIIYPTEDPIPMPVPNYTIPPYDENPAPYPKPKPISPKPQKPKPNPPPNPVDDTLIKDLEDISKIR